MLPSSGFRIGRLFGIDIVVSPSWVIIYLLVGTTFGSIFRAPLEIFPGLENYLENHPIPAGPWPWIVGFITAAVFFVCLLLHELSHSLVARRSGIPISKITLFLFGGVAEMAEDVKSPGTEFRMAIAGPLVTFLIAGLLFFAYWLSVRLEGGALVVVPLLYLAFVNLAIGIFNLLPGFPLDGGRVLRSTIWQITGSLERATRVASLSGQVVAVLLVAVGVFSLLVQNLVGGFWFILIGMFLHHLAAASYRQTLFRIAASDTSVGDIMYTDVPVIDSGVSLTALRNTYFAAYRLPVFPVAHDGTLTGAVFRSDLDIISVAEWDLLDAGRVARPVSTIETVSPSTPLDRILKKVLGNEEFLLVVEDGHARGILTREALLRYVDSRAKRGRKKG